MAEPDEHIEIIPGKDRPDIQIEYGPKIKHVSPFYRDGWISMMLCGRSGCGKTSLMSLLIPGISDKIRIVCIATLVYNNPFHLAIKKWCEDTKRVCVINDDPEKIRRFVTEARQMGAIRPGEQEMIIIFDDFAIHNRSDRHRENLVIEAFTRWRNLGVNVVVVCQDATMVAPQCRNCIGIKILFNSDPHSMYSFNKNVLSLAPDPENYQELMRYITQVPYSYVVVRDGPFDVSVGQGRSIRPVMTAKSVIVPTFKEIMSEIGVRTPEQLDKKTREIQKRIGNTAHQLEGPAEDEVDAPR